MFKRILKRIAEELILKRLPDIIDIIIDAINKGDDPKEAVKNAINTNQLKF